MKSEQVLRVKKPHLGPYMAEVPSEVTQLIRPGPDGQTWIHRAAGRLQSSALNTALVRLQSSNPARLPFATQQTDSFNRSPIFLACAGSPTSSQTSTQRLDTLRTLVAFGDCRNETS